ncbi:MAG: HAMP domain-containing histidine kinase [Candidatus Thiodiazotropha endolucinida]|nr:HAMP domain-containing histidine kinase [Candidatus Thiodiazotropha endolucinida]
MIKLALMDKFENELLDLDSESYWTGQDLMDASVGRRILRGFLEKLLATLMNQCPGCTSGYVAITGLEAGKYVPLVAIGRDVKKMAQIRIGAKDTAVSGFIEGDKRVEYVTDVQGNPYYKGTLPYCEKLLIRLEGFGEKFGFISLDAAERGVFREDFVTKAETHQPLIARICADAVFSMRLLELAVPFEQSAKKGLNELYQEITNRALRIFAADGVVLRIYNYERDRLEAEAFAPVDGDDIVLQVADTLLEADSVGEAVCRMVHEDEGHTWAVGMIGGEEEPEFSGTTISSDMEAQLRALGICDYCVFQLISEVKERREGEPMGIGTLAFFHRHRHPYSWRDISMARSLCQRAADTIALFNKTQALQETTDRMFLDSAMMTRVEIVTLLTHDLGHKAIALEDTIQELISSTKKAMREGRRFPSIQSDANQVVEAAEQMTRSLNSINTLFKSKGAKGVPQESEFRLFDVAQEVKETMKDALHRNKCELNIKGIEKELKIYGRRPILLQAIFNLVINAIDAQKSRSNLRNNTITMIAEKPKSGDTVILKLWDEGPGINRKRFPNPNEIFKLGETSKPSGTGRGLTISRSLLGEFFGAHLRLENPENAMFIITFPLNHKK